MPADSPGLSSSPLSHSVDPIRRERAPGWDVLANWSAFPVVCGILVGLASFMNTVDINYGYANGEDYVGLDLQVAIKLVIAAACSLVGLIGVLISPTVRGALVSLPGCILVALGVVFLGTSTVALAEASTVSRVAAVVYMGYLMFAVTALSVLGLRKLTVICLVALLVNLIINWVLYLGFPATGVFEEELAGQTFVKRMGGLGHPNSIARTAVLAGILCLSMLRSHDLAPRVAFGRTVLFMIIVLSLMTTVATFSRTAVVAGFVAAAFLLLDKISTRWGSVLALSLATLVGGGLLAIELISGGGLLGDTFLSVATKTGEITELTSATGRTAIWAESVRLIAERPLMGYGLNSAPFLMLDFSLHTHNLLLHALMSGGVIAGILVLCLLAWNVFFGLASDEPLVRAISIYVIVSGIFEDTVLDTFASPSTMLWLIVMLYPSVRVLSHRYSKTFVSTI